MSSTKKSPTTAQKDFLLNVTKQPPSNNNWDDWEENNRYRNTINIMDGGILEDYREYLQEKCDKLCRFKVVPEYKVLYQTNSIIKEYIDNECEKCSIKLKTFNREFDSALKSVYPDKSPSSPTTQFELPLLLLERGTEILNAISAPDIKAELEAFKPLDEEDWRKEIAQTEIDLNALIEEEKKKKTQRVNITTKGANRFRRLNRFRHPNRFRRGGGTKRKKRKKRTRKRKRKRTRKRRTRKRLNSK